MTTLATPLYAVVGAGDLALTQLNEAVASLRERTEAATEDAQARFEKAKVRFNELPEEVPASLEELKGKFTADEVKEQVDAYVALATTFYNGLAERGEEALDRLRTQPLVAENIERAALHPLNISATLALERFPIYLHRSLLRRSSWRTRLG